MVSIQGDSVTKEILDYLSGEIPLEEAVYILKQGHPSFCQTGRSPGLREKDVRWLELERQFQNDRKKGPGTYIG